MTDNELRNTKYETRSPARPFANQGGVVALAHRGFRGLYPENTMLAFEKAAAMSIDGLEIDIHSTKDGVLVVCHDETVDRTTEGSGRIQDFTLAELQQLDAGYRFTPDEGQNFPFRGRGIRIPTLAAVFEHFPDMWVNVDIKQHEVSVVRPFANLIRQYNMAEWMCVGSFDNQTVADFRRACPEVARAASLGETLRLFLLNKVKLTRFYKGKAHVLQIPEIERGIRVITPQFIQAAHRNKTAVHVWTVNETADMERLIEWGVDGIISDYPDRLLQVLGRV
ncbi:MAG: glycerophosphodiester phosphodiesterase [Chloroflexi bacterium]|nr:glycerophosphodiester phosphodiesterase [Chloroflexota bacterium]